METPWEESLDIDDSDLQSFSVLRPCKQQRRRDTTTTAAADCSQSQTLVFSQPPPQTVESHPEIVPPPQFRQIPGPAGIIQAAKLRKSLETANSLGQEEAHLMATQDYIRKVIEDPKEDDDFKRAPWISAIEFIHSDGMLNGVSNASLGDIKKYEKKGKLEQVVAVIKSCAPNALGDLTVTLKDPTGTVSGTIHHKVITEGEFSKGICVGSALILRKVSVFSPSRSAHYLNITKRNLVKVFYKDGGSSQVQIFDGYKSTDAAPGSDSGQGTQSLHNAYSQERGARTMNGIKIIPNSKLSLPDDMEQENINPIASIGSQYCKTSNYDMTQRIAPENEILIEADAIRNGENEHVEPGTVHVHVKPATSASVPSWTDDQVNILDFDLEDI
uniref:homologous recombination OB-fold protein n=1 Tax=Erigeron canadensis TaxID=72917 RepID=UPI001CB926B9|nr:homologous recombination OB-fold protein [Erigeron canadensis]